jgi:anionic cell wall polymer biosynthesis LytR-Cps2A-Psr (LCP) family protein
MARQKCVMNAMLRQLDPTTVVTRFGDIAAAGEQVLSTSIPRSEIATFVDLGLKAKSLPVSSISFVPPRIDTGDPDWELIRSMVDRAIERSTAMDDPDTEQPDDGGQEKAAKKKRDRRDADANGSADLGNAC